MSDEEAGDDRGIVILILFATVALAASRYNESRRADPPKLPEVKRADDRERPWPKWKRKRQSPRPTPRGTE